MNIKLLTLIAAGAVAVTPCAGRQIVSTDAYSWHGDTITQGPFMATAPDGNTIISTYHAQPGYFMPVEQEWHLKNDISSYPRLLTPNKLHTAVYNMALDEMVNAVEPDTTLRTGKEWAGVWTRDVSYSILLSMAYMQPEAARISLMKKVDPMGRIIQDTGSGGAWPVSTDRMIWAVAAYEVYLVTGDRSWLEYIYPIVRRSLEDDLKVAYAADGLVHGETSFIDWREQSYPKWMQTADIYRSEALSTSVVHARAMELMSRMAADLGYKSEARMYEQRAREQEKAIDSMLWNADRSQHDMYRYGRNHLMNLPRTDVLGEALAIMWDVTPAEKQAAVSASTPVTKYGAPVFFPQISDMPAYHNNALWPWVASWWTLASAKTANEQGVLQGIGSVFRPAALFATNKENLNLDNGDIATELNSSNMLWCLSGNIALTHKILFGLDFTEAGLAFKPFVPEALGQTRTLENFMYRGARLDITVNGYGSAVASFTVNGKEQKALITPAQAAKAAKNGKTLKIEITMDNQPIKPVPVNLTENVKAPLTPLTRLDGAVLRWNPIEYIGGYRVYRDGKLMAQTRNTSFELTEPGEYQVTGVSEAGVESFASEPVEYLKTTVIQLPEEVTVMKSGEVSYEPGTGAISGYSGDGFVELDRRSPAVDIKFSTYTPGEKYISFIYANGNGPVNTENKCAIRTVSIDGKKAGTIVMPHRGVGNWYDWGSTNVLSVQLEPGEHTVTVSFEPENNNMNIDTNHALIDAMIIRE